MDGTRPLIAVWAAIKTVGMLANAAYAVVVLQGNAMIETNVLHAAHCAGVDKLPGSS